MPLAYEPPDDGTSVRVEHATLEGEPLWGTAMLTFGVAPPAVPGDASWFLEPERVLPVPPVEADVVVELDGVRYGGHAVLAYVRPDLRHPPVYLGVGPLRPLEG